MGSNPVSSTWSPQSFGGARPSAGVHCCCCDCHCCRQGPVAPVALQCAQPEALLHEAEVPHPHVAQAGVQRGQARRVDAACRHRLYQQVGAAYLCEPYVSTSLADA